MIKEPKNTCNGNGVVASHSVKVPQLEVVAIERELVVADADGGFFAGPVALVESEGSHNFYSVSSLLMHSPRICLRVCKPSNAQKSATRAFFYSCCR